MHPLPLPLHYQSGRIDQVWRVPYQQRAFEARAWADQHGILPVFRDKKKVGLLLVDVQNTFCVPEYELFVAGRSGTGAVDDNRRLCEFIYRNLHRITEITITMDTHQAIQIFHAIFLVDKNGNHPDPYTQITLENIENGHWMLNPALFDSLQLDASQAWRYLLHYTRSLKQRGKYDWTIWPYHAMLGGIGHALVSSIEEAIFFHTLARYAHPDFIVKGDNPLTEHYSVIGPEVRTDADGKPIAQKSETLVNKLHHLDALLIAGQAKSHCVAWTVEDLLEDIRRHDPALAGKIYLLEDCTSPVVVPGADYTEAADKAYQQFAQAGMHIVRAEDWDFSEVDLKG
jgi:nicotinamidase-related amidase